MTLKLREARSVQTNFAKHTLYDHISHKPRPVFRLEPVDLLKSLALYQEACLLAYRHLALLDASRESRVFSKTNLQAYQWRGVVNKALYSVQSLKRCLRQKASIAPRLKVSRHIYLIPCATAMLYSIRQSGDQAECWTIISRLVVAVAKLELLHQSRVCTKHAFWCKVKETVRSRCAMIKTLPWIRSSARHKHAQSWNNHT